MQKYLFLLLIVYMPFMAFAQQRTKIVLRESKEANYDNYGPEQIVHLKFPVFVHDNAILTCDSAIFYPARNTFEAYENVHINQADTTNIYSKRLTYNGNTKMAHLTDNVRMLDKNSVLTTNILDYDMAAKIGTYVTGGKIVNKDVKITSKNGYYFANSRDAYFRYNVIVITDQSTITSDTLRYNTLTNWSYFYGPTNIKGKDDNLYTENGAYNTKDENAYFGKNNLYTQGSKSLKGDSLYYFGKIGYGKAVKNIVFIDTSNNTLLRGQLGEYYKADEKAVVTQNAYLGMGTTDSVMVNDIKQPDTLWLAADTLEAMKALQKTLKLIPKPVVRSTAQLAKAELPDKAPPKKTAATQTPPAKQDNKDDKKKTPPVVKKGADSTVLKPPVMLPDSLKGRIKTDSAVVKPPDTLAAKPDKKVTKADSSTAKSPVKAAEKPDKSVKPVIKDSVITNPLDTMRTRIIKAYHNVKVYKANLQARADSLFYTDADSTLRWYKNPILWAEGSQQTGDTIYAQLKNRKLNTVQVIGNGFIVNVEEDSTKFNQIKGKTILGIFNAGELQRMIVDGNAESIYFDKDDKTKKYTQMNQTVSGRINAFFEKKELKKVQTILNAEGARTPIAELTEEKRLTGFSWKPDQRPKSKLDVIGPPYKKPVKETKKPVKKPAVKTQAKKG